MSEVRIEKLEQLLQKSYKDPQLKVLDYAASKLLSIGENYATTVIKVDAKVSSGKSQEVRELELVAKLMPRHEKDYFLEWKVVLPKELFMYSELISAYRNLEREAGIDETDLINILPKYVGCRYSLEDNDDPTLIDDNSLLLLENIKTLGYESCNRLVGLEANSAKVALSALARFHSLGIALKQKRPDFASKAISVARTLGIDFEKFDLAFENVLKSCRQISGLKKYLPVVESSFAEITEGKTYKCLPEEPWATIIHGDFWTENILFRRDEQGRIDDVKFLDFQTYLYASPLKELPYFLCGCLDDEAFDERFDEILNAYYESLLNFLELLGCDTRPYSRDAFEAELKKQALREIPLVAMLVKYVYREVISSESGTIYQVFGNKGNDDFEKKMTKVIVFYEKRGWI